MKKILIVLTTLWKISQSTFHIVETIRVSFTKFYLTLDVLLAYLTLSIVYGFFYLISFHIVEHQSFYSHFMENFYPLFPQSGKSTYIVISTMLKIQRVLSSFGNVSRRNLENFIVYSIQYYLTIHIVY